VIGRLSMHVGQAVSAEGNRLALERWFGQNMRELPHVSLTTLPTRVHRLSHWSDLLGIEVWVKRDDETNPRYGGNKPRKLEFLLGEALQAGSRRVLTFGGLGTHHGLATALFAREVGLRVGVGLLYQPVTAAVRENLLALHALDAELFYGARVPALAAKAAWRWLQYVRAGERPYVIPTGGSSAVGTLGYVNAAFEFAEQVRAGDLPVPERVFVPLGSGGTVAGLALGLKAAGLRTRVVGVLVSDIYPPSPRKLCRLAARTAAYLKAKAGIPLPALTEKDFFIERGCLGAGYGAALPPADAVATWLHQHEGIKLDGTYTAKAALALERWARQHRTAGPVLFWLTYSQARVVDLVPALPDYHALPRELQRFFENP